MKIDMTIYGAIYSGVGAFKNQAAERRMDIAGQVAALCCGNGHMEPARLHGTCHCRCRTKKHGRAKRKRFQEKQGFRR